MKRSFPVRRREALFGRARGGAPATGAAGERGVGASLHLGAAATRARGAILQVLGRRDEVGENPAETPCLNV